MTRKRWLSLARIVIGVGALAFLLWRIGLGETIDVLRAANPHLLLAAFGLFVLSLFIRAGRWAVLLHALRLGVPFGKLVYLYFVGAFFNSFLPSGFGGDVVRALELTEDAPPPAAVGTVLVDRMTGLLVLLAMGLVALPFSAGQLAPWLVWLLVAVAGGGLAGGALLLEGRLLRRLTGWLPERISLAGSGPLAKVYTAVTACGWRAIGRALLISLAFNVVNVVINFLCGRAVGIGLGLGYFLVTAPLISITLMIPISVGGVGVRDWVTVALFTPAGVDSNTAAAMSLALYGVSAAAGLVGGGLYVWRSVRGVMGRAAADEAGTPDAPSH
jgi:uncharacterized membrane protein YbhN (UPF0104 family)